MASHTIIAPFGETSSRPRGRPSTSGGVGHSARRSPERRRPATRGGTLTVGLGRSNSSASHRDYQHQHQLSPRYLANPLLVKSVSGDGGRGGLYVPPTGGVHLPQPPVTLRGIRRDAEVGL